MPKSKDVNAAKQAEIAYRRTMEVAKSNDLIRYSRYNMEAQEQKILNTLISMIKPGDKPDKRYSISVKDFALICNIDYTQGNTYEAVKSAIKSFADESVWIKQKDGSEILFRWLNNVKIEHKTGIIEFDFHQAIAPYLFGQKKNFTKYMLAEILAMKSKYAIPLYEYLKCYMYDVNEIGFCVITVKLDALKERIAATDYQRFPDFRRYVLEKATTEINTYASDLKVEYELKKLNGSRAYNAVEFILSVPTEPEKAIREGNCNIELWK